MVMSGAQHRAMRGEQTREQVTREQVTPAEERRTRAGMDPEPLRVAAGVPSAVAFLAGVWLVLGPLALDYRHTGRFLAYWNEVVIGVALAIVSLIRAYRPVRSAALSGVNVVLGGWLIASPFVLHYGANTRPMWNNVIVGAVVVALAVLGFALTAAAMPASYAVRDIARP